MYAYVFIYSAIICNEEEEAIEKKRTFRTNARIQLLA